MHVGCRILISLSDKSRKLVIYVVNCRVYRNVKMTHIMQTQRNVHADLVNWKYTTYAIHWLAETT